MTADREPWLECWGGPMDGRRTPTKVGEREREFPASGGRYIRARPADVKPKLRRSPLAALLVDVWRWWERFP